MVDPQERIQHLDITTIDGTDYYRRDLIVRYLAQHEDDICQTLGKALGYPWFKDHQRAFPCANETHGVCVGEHIAESIAEEAADVIAKQRELLTKAYAVIEEAKDCLDGRMFEEAHETLKLYLEDQP